MPIATGLTAPDRHDLKSLPGAYVILRRMSWGEKLTRKSFMSKIKVGQELSTSTGNRADRRRQQTQSFMAEMDMANEKVTAYEFAVSIVDHNLTYLARANDPTSETKLDFKNPDHVKMLDGNVGEEIDEIITELNDFENDGEVGKSQTSSETSLLSDQQD